MAEVWLARAIGLRDFEKIVVLKRILRHKREDPRFIGMLRDEARVVATLDHPNIVHTLDVGLEGEELFITMEYLHGEDVKSILGSARKVGELIPLELVVQIAMGVAAGLHHAHEQTDSKGRALNIVHRDVSPANVIVTHHSGVKLIDFGIAVAKSRKEHTAVGMLKGKAAYMSPEQCRGQPLDRRCDVFALGILLYEMTTMVRPFEGESHLAVMHQLCNEDPVPPSELRKDYPAALERVVLRALHRDPDKRHQSAFEVLEELERVTRDCTLHALPGALARYLEHLFGPRPHPWHTARKQLAAAGRADLETTQTSQKPEKPKTAIPPMTAETALASGGVPELVPVPHDQQEDETAGVAFVAISTQRAIPAIPDAEYLALSAAGPPEDRSSLMIVTGSVVAAAALVGLATRYSSEAPLAVGPVVVVASVASVVPETPSRLPPSQAPAAAQKSESSPAVAPAPTQMPTPAPAPAIETASKEQESPQKPPRRSVPRAPKKDSANARGAEARRLLQQARTMLFRNPRATLDLTLKSLALKRTAAAYSLLGMSACRLQDEIMAKKAYRNLTGRLREDVAASCKRAGVELK
ncbi:MAG: protein kinase [Nannocystaceae bacterium]|nr:protein kinase [Nannocystaceae bacterium]